MAKVYYLNPIGVDKIEPPPRLIWRFKIQCPDCVINWIVEHYPDAYIYLKNTYPAIGYVYLHSRRVRDWLADYLPKNRWMTWTYYPGKKTDCELCGHPSDIIYNNRYLCKRHYNFCKEHDKKNKNEL